jgi:hypothetical protein
MAQKGKAGKGGGLIDPAFKEFATALQAEAIDAVNAAGGHRVNAAKALGVPVTSLKDRLQAVLRKAERRSVRGPSGTLATTPPVQLAEGQELKRQTVHLDAAGNLLDRYDLSQTAKNPPAYAPVPEAFHVSKITTRLDADGRVGMQYVTSKPEEVARWNAMVSAVREVCAELPAAEPTPSPCETEADTLAVYGLGDPHIGMLSWGLETGQDFDLKIANENTQSVVNRLVAAAPSSSEAVLVLVGDNFHADDDRQITPGHGHKLDVDTRAAKVFRVGYWLWIACITYMLTKHGRCRVVVVRGHHDPLTSFFLAEVLRTYFRHEPRVEVLDNVREHQYIAFGGVLLGFCHGHKTRPEGLAGVMAADEPDLWAAAKACRHWITGHIHSKTWWDFRGCSLETLRTLAPEDAYARGAGYRSAQDSVVITYHAKFGEIARSTVNLARAGIESKAAGS